ncbi:MAG TPA: S-layer protein, partial [Candidatus Saccharimonadia bacterium]|nr:S-layer protein [Candidatus Saccharimonadia bacterium]
MSLVTSAVSAAEVSFRNQVQPILARYGCSSGACHGAAAGQGGFRLSLRGYDNTGDYLSITRSAQGRRITLEDPSRSLLLMKSTKAVPHKGGEKIKTDWPECQTLAEWTANGAPGPQEKAARIQRIEVSPSHVTL